MRLRLLFFLGAACFPLHFFAKIYVCFPFFNELTVLEAHLEELYPLVDYFVINESCETHSGLPKPFYLKEHWDRFAKYHDKIIRIETTTTHPEGTDPWERERSDRDQLLRGLSACDDDDLVLHCDCDEIVSREGFKRGLEEFNNRLSEGKEPVAVFVIDFFRHYFNLRHEPHPPWSGPAMCRYKVLRSILPRGLRSAGRGWENFVNKQNHANFRVAIFNSGWHFTHQVGDDLELLYQKSLANIDGCPSYKARFVSDRRFAREKIISNIESSTIVPIDEALPVFVRENEQRLFEEGFLVRKGEGGFILSDRTSWYYR